MTRLVLTVALAFGIAVLAASGCGPPAPPSGEPKQLQGDRIPKGAGPTHPK